MKPARLERRIGQVRVVQVPVVEAREDADRRGRAAQNCAASVDSPSASVDAFPAEITSATLSK